MIKNILLTKLSNYQKSKAYAQEKGLCIPAEGPFYNQTNFANRLITGTVLAIDKERILQSAFDYNSEMFTKEAVASALLGIVGSIQNFQINFGFGLEILPESGYLLKCLYILNPQHRFFQFIPMFRPDQNQNQGTLTQLNDLFVPSFKQKMNIAVVKEEIPLEVEMLNQKMTLVYDTFMFEKTHIRNFLVQLKNQRQQTEYLFSRHPYPIFLRLLTEERAISHLTGLKNGLKKGRKYFQMRSTAGNPTIRPPVIRAYDAFGKSFNLFHIDFVASQLGLARAVLAKRRAAAQ